MQSSASASGPVKRTLAAGALSGAGAWLAYATLEYALWELVPRAMQSHCGCRPLWWNSGLGLFALYPLFGAVLGGFVALVTARIAPEWPARAGFLVSRATTLPLLAFIALGITQQFEIRGLGRALLGMTGFLGLTVMASVWTRGRIPGWSLLTNVWVLSALLLGSARVATEVTSFEPRFVVYGTWVVYLIACAVAALVRPRRSERDVVAATDTLAGSLRQLSIAAMAIILAVVTAFALDSAGVPARIWSSAARPSNRPNVVLIVMDTTRADHLSVYGYERDTTPRLRELAADAMVYTRALAASDHTLSSHSSLFTGLYPSSHGAHPPDPTARGVRTTAGYALSNDHRTLAELLSQAGYYTTAFVANYAFVTGAYNLNQGFDAFGTRFERCAAPAPLAFIDPARGSRTLSLRAYETTYQNAAEMNADVLPTTRTLARRNHPFFLFVNYMDAHAPYTPPPPFDTRFPGRGLRIGRDDFQLLRDAVLTQQQALSPADRAHLISQYDGSIAFLDSEIGHVIDELKRLGAYDETLLIVTADHGEAFGERQLMEHGTSLYQDQVHVPLIVKMPGSKTVGTRHDTVSLIDVLPTVLTTVGLQVPRGVEGRNLLERPDPTRIVLSESYPREYMRSLHKRFLRVERASVAGPIKLIVSNTGKREMYNLDTDPRETENLYSQQDPLCARLEGVLKEWAIAAQTRKPGGPLPALNSESIERLRSLGYVK